MGSTQTHLPTLPPVTPVHRFPPIRPRILLPLVVAVLGAAETASELALRARGRVIRRAAPSA